MPAPAISERFPHIAPRTLTQPWLVAFTTRARRGGRPLSFAATEGEANRRELEQALTPLHVTWLTLEHGTKIALLNSNNAEDVRGAPITPERCSPIADAAIVVSPGTAVAFTTADCLPIVCADTRDHVVAGIHAGWRSLAAGIIERTVESLCERYGVQPETLEVWIGPAIAREDYEVGSDVRDALLARPAVTSAHFSRSPNDATRWCADLPGAATSILMSLGIPALAIERHPESTRQSPLLHSARRDGAQSGRMATVVGIRE
jgi:YfiH family protein